LAIAWEDLIAYPDVTYSACPIGRVRQLFQAGADFLTEVCILGPWFDDALGFTPLEVDTDAAFQVGG
jgi:hypothetical protein